MKGRVCLLENRGVLALFLGGDPELDVIRLQIDLDWSLTGHM